MCQDPSSKSHTCLIINVFCILYLFKVQILYLYLYLCVCVHTYWFTHVPCVCSAQGAQKRASDYQEMEIQVVRILM